MPPRETELIGYAVALSIGLLIGIERERAKGTGSGRAPAGVRTFLLIALCGAIAYQMGAIGTAVAGALMATLIVVSYRRTRETDPGLTTEVAMLVTFLLGMMAMRDAAMAGGLGTVVVLALASKSRLHRFTRQALSEKDLHDAIVLIAAAFVILPMLPDHPIDPWGAINPRKLWILVVAVMSVSSAAYIALRAFGARLGLALAGLAGGFVSSTATIAAMAGRARAAPELTAAFASAGLLSNVGTVVQLAIVVGALSPALLGLIRAPLLAAGLVAVAFAAVSSWRSFGASQAGFSADGNALDPGRPFEAGHVLGFAALIATIMLISAMARTMLGQGSLPWVLAASGLADVHAAAASAAQLVQTQKMQADAAVLAINAALAANSLMKLTVAWLRGGRRFAARLAPGVVLMVVAFAAVSIAW